MRTPIQPNDWLKIAVKNSVIDQATADKIGNYIKEYSEKYEVAIPAQESLLNVMNLFSWDDTAEGDDYWSSVYTVLARNNQVHYIDLIYFTYGYEIDADINEFDALIANADELKKDLCNYYAHIVVTLFNITPELFVESLRQRDLPILQSAIRTANKEGA